MKVVVQEVFELFEGGEKSLPTTLVCLLPVPISESFIYIDSL